MSAIQRLQTGLDVLLFNEDARHIPGDFECFSHCAALGHETGHIFRCGEVHAFW